MGARCSWWDTSHGLRDSLKQDVWAAAKVAVAARHPRESDRGAADNGRRAWGPNTGASVALELLDAGTSLAGTSSWVSTEEWKRRLLAVALGLASSGKQRLSPPCPRLELGRPPAERRTEMGGGGMLQHKERLRDPQGSTRNQTSPHQVGGHAWGGKGPPHQGSLLVLTPQGQNLSQVRSDSSRLREGTLHRQASVRASHHPFRPQSDVRASTAWLLAAKALKQGPAQPRRARLPCAHRHSSKRRARPPRGRQTRNLESQRKASPPSCRSVPASVQAA